MSDQHQRDSDRPSGSRPAPPDASGGGAVDDRFLHVIESFPDAVLLVDRHGTIVGVNTNAARLFGHSASAMIGQAFDFLIPERYRERHTGHLATYLANPTVRSMGQTLELCALKRDGSECPVEISLSPVEISLSPVIGEPGLIIMAAICDITPRKTADEERRKLDRQFQHGQKMESLGVLAGGIAHDFNNLLTGILGNASLALKRLSPESPVRNLLERIERAGGRAADLVGELLAYAGKGSFTLQAVNLSRMVEEMTHLLDVSISKRAVLRFDLEQDLPAVLADATQLRQIMMNLITNASDAIGDRSGVISITTGVTHADCRYLEQAHVEVPREGYYAYVEVSDTGIGMDETTRARIFDPFFSTKPTGRGLGLAAVLGIVRAHNGAIRVYTQPRRGTTVKVLFPVSELPAAESTEVPWDWARWRASGTILVADDDDSVRAVVQSILEACGLTVMTAHDGREAVELFRAHAERIDVVILDLTMPHLDGVGAFSELRRQNPQLPVVLMSGYNEGDAAARLAGKGLAGFVQKPIRPAQLMEKVRDALELDISKG